MSIQTVLWTPWSPHGTLSPFYNGVIRGNALSVVLKRIRNAAKFKRLNLKRLRKLRSRQLLLRRRETDRHRKAAYAQLVAPRRYHPAFRKEVPTLVSPMKLNLSADIQETANFLARVRAASAHYGGRMYVDLRPLKEMTAAAALAMVAEFDRWRDRVTELRLEAVDVAEWDPIVKRRLDEMGFFEILGAKCDVTFEPDPTQDRYIKFLSGKKADGGAALSLRESIEALGPKLLESDALYDGLVEAMGNVREHAYKVDAPVKRWWLSASVNVDSTMLTVMFLDHGLGIPSTLPRSELWENIRGLLGKLDPTGALLKDDAKLIEAAFSVQRSSTGEENRGRGLREDILGYIELYASEGRLRVLSNRGMYTYQKTRDGTSKSTRALPTRLPGTFVEWKIERYAGEPANDHH